MLDNLKPGDTIDETSTMEELKNACESALPKIKNMLKEEQDAEKLELLNEVKSIIKGVVLKYQDIKHGHYDTKYDISGKFKSEEENLPPQAISLIDLDDIVDSPSPQASSSKGALDELSDIFGEKTSISSNTSTSTPTFNTDPFDLLSQSIRLNTLPPSSPNLVTKNTTTSSSSSSSPIIISSPQQHQDTQVERTSKSHSIINALHVCHILTTYSVNLINKNGLLIQMDLQTSGSTTYKFKAYYSNKSTAPMDKMTLLLAAPKVRKRDEM